MSCSFCRMVSATKASRATCPFSLKRGTYPDTGSRLQRLRPQLTLQVSVGYAMPVKRNVPFEDVNANSAASCTPVLQPREVRPTVLRLWHPESQPQAFLKPDIWHSFHGGCGADFIASALAEALIFLLKGSKDVRRQQVDELQVDWKTNWGGRIPYSGHFSSERLALTSYQALPSPC